MLKRIVTLLVFLIGFSHPSFSQAELASKKAVTALARLAEGYLRSADFDKSLLTSRKALSAAISINDDYLIASSYIIIAGNYDELSEYDKAIYFYQKAMSYAERTDNAILKHRAINNLGNMFCFEKKQYEKGINYYKQSIEYAIKAGAYDRIFYTKLNIAWAYFDIGKYDQGFPYLKSVNENNNKFGNETTVVVINMLNGMYSSHKNQTVKANEFFVKAIKLGIEVKDKSDLSYSYQEYSKFLKKNKEYEKAYQNLELYNNIKDELYDNEKLEKAEVIGINLQLDEYKREIDKIAIEKDNQYQSLKKSRIIVVLFIVAVCVLLLLLLTFYKNNNFKRIKNAELVLANKELSMAKEKAEEVSLLKTQFVSTISHELRTPLYGVVGITNMLLDEHKELASSPHLNSLKFSARYLLSLVNDILQINKIEEKRVVLETLTFNISDEINVVTNSLQFIANKNENKTIVDIDPTIPEFLIGDKLRLSQILMNLASNALKFTKKGEVHITAKQVEVKGKFHYIEFQVADNGIGIDKFDQDKIYDKFVQIGRKEDDYQGTGLGLAIVKRLIELFDSEIHVESELNKGTTFTFTIAFEADDEKVSQIINNIEVDLTSSQILKVLVVEDNKINQVVTRKIIEKNNYKCDIVDDGIIALEILDRETYDVILMDINMPIINGFETTRRIRSKGITTPIIALTAFDKEEITEEAISAGMNDIIIKPFEPVKLFQIINSQINKSRN